MTESGVYYTDLLITERQNPEYPATSGPLSNIFHLVLLDNQRNDSCSCNLITFLHGKISMPRCDHHLSIGINHIEFVSIYLKKAIACGDYFNLSFLNIAWACMFAFTDII